MVSALRVGGVVAALVLGCTASGAARADQLVWHFTGDDTSAYIAVINATELASEEADAAFSMSCSSFGDEETIVSNLDAKAVGAALTAGQVPSYHFVIDGKPDDAGDAIADIHFDEMSGIWQYVVNGADTSALLDAKTIKIEGVGVSLDLPTDQQSALLHKFRTACDTLESTADDGEDDSGDSGDSGN